MLDVVQAIFLGMVQGVTELLPISSSLHVLLAERLISPSIGDPKLFASLIQLGSALAILLRLKGDIKSLILGLFRREESARGLFIALVLAFFPAVLVGAFFHSAIKAVCYSMSLAAFSLIIGGVVFILLNPISQSMSRTLPSKKGALFIGFFQIFSLIPGVSRLGSTLIGGTIAGLSRPAALRFSFLLAIPILFGAGCFELLTLSAATSCCSLSFFIPGTLTAFLCTYFLFPVFFPVSF